MTLRGFPSGPEAKNLPANAGDVDSSPGTGRSHNATEQLGLWASPLEPTSETPEAGMPRACGPQQEKSLQQEDCTLRE